jgi:hypothetical protein
MTRIMMVCLLAIAINAVLIQTITAEDSALKNGVRVTVLCIAAFAMLLHNSRMPVGMVLMIIFSVMLLTWRQNPDQLTFIFVFILVPALFSVRERSLGKLVVFSSAVSLLLVFAFLVLGITQNEVTEFRGRNTFGTNGVPFFYNLVYGALTMLLVYVHKYKHKFRFLWTVAGVVLATHLFNLTDARGGYYAFLIFVGLLYTIPALGRVGLFRFITVILPIAFLCAAFYIASLYENSAANKLLSVRPTLYQRFVENLTAEDIFLSSTVKQFTRAVTIVDNSYLHLLVGGGVVLSLVFFVIFAQAVARLYRMAKYVDVAFLIATCIYFNSESIMLRIENMFVIYFWYLIIRHSKPLIRIQDGMALQAKRVKSSDKRPPAPSSKTREPRKKKPAKVRVPDWHHEHMDGPVNPGRLPDWASPDRG